MLFPNDQSISLNRDGLEQSMVNAWDVLRRCQVDIFEPAVSRRDVVVFEITAAEQESLSGWYPDYKPPFFALRKFINDSIAQGELWGLYGASQTKYEMAGGKVESGDGEAIRISFDVQEMEST